MITKNIKTDINKLLSYNFFSDDFEPEDEAYDYAEELVDYYSVDEIIQEFKLFIESNCNSKDDLINVINLAWIYGFHELKIKDSIDLVAFLCFKSNIMNNKDEIDYTLDSFIISILENNRIASLYKDPYYDYLDDERIKNRIKQYEEKTNELH